MTPQLLGTKVYKEYAVKDVVDYIDWNPFFQVGVGVYHAPSCPVLPCPALPCIMLTACLTCSPIHPPTHLSLACLPLLAHSHTCPVADLLCCVAVARSQCTYRMHSASLYLVCTLILWLMPSKG